MSSHVRNRLHRLGNADDHTLPVVAVDVAIAVKEQQQEEDNLQQASRHGVLKSFRLCRRFFFGLHCLNLKFVSFKRSKRLVVLCLFLLLLLCGLGGVILFVVGIISGSYQNPIGWNTSTILCLVPSTTYFISPQCGFHTDWHPLSRHDRFPSVQERVQLYMSTWYLPPCSSLDRLRFHYHPSIQHHDNVDFGTPPLPPLPPPPPPPFVTILFPMHHGETNDNIVTTNMTLQTKMEPDTIFVLNENGFKQDFGRYPQDAQKMLSLFHGLFPGYTTMQLPPIVITLGDSGGFDFAHHPIPYFCKWRPVATRSSSSNNWKKWMEVQEGVGGKTNHSNHNMKKCIESVEQRGRFGREIYAINQTMYAPIIWGVSYRRHFRYVSWVPWYDTWWEKKKQGAIWRGVLTGAKGRIVMGDSFVSNCQRVPRCTFVMKFRNSNSLNVGVSFQLDEFPVVGEMYVKSMVKDTVSLRNMMQYKAIIILEGNDVASGLKWALYSRSVVLMPEPTKTSYAMEELLVPWVHYIPLSEDGLDAEEKLNWVLENDEEARKIAERATLFMHDLLFHENAARDNMEVEMEIIRRYYSLYDHSR